MYNAHSCLKQETESNKRRLKQKKLSNFQMVKRFLDTCQSDWVGGGKQKKFDVIYIYMYIIFFFF